MLVPPRNVWSGPGWPALATGHQRAAVGTVTSAAAMVRSAPTLSRLPANTARSLPPVTVSTLRSPPSGPGTVIVAPACTVMVMPGCSVAGSRAGRLASYGVVSLAGMSAPPGTAIVALAGTSMVSESGAVRPAGSLTLLSRGKFHDAPLGSVTSVFLASLFR